jgi:colanic acid/amylovoran biosynthesis protein
MNIKVSIIAANFAGNKGAAAMLKSVVGNLSEKYRSISYNLLSVYPREDRKQNPYKNLKIISCKPQEIIFIAFPLAISFYIFKWIKPLRNIITKYHILKGFYEAELVIDVAGISFVDSRGFVMNTYNFICIATPLLLGKKIIKYSQAMGPFNTKWNKLLAKITLPKLYHICARGEITKNNLESLELKNISICADGAFILPDCKEVEKNIKKIIKDDPFYSKKIVSISISSVVEKYCGKIGIDYKGIIAKFIDYLIEIKNYGVLIIANSAREGIKDTKNNDLIVCGNVFRIVKNKQRCRWYNKEFTPEELRELIGLSKYVVASRFHAMIGALYNKIPVLLIGWSHKYKEVLDMFRLGENAIDYRELSLERLINDFENIEKNYKDFKKKITENLPAVIDSSRKNIEIIEKVLDKNRL